MMANRPGSTLEHYAAVGLFLTLFSWRINAETLILSRSLTEPINPLINGELMETPDTEATDGLQSKTDVNNVFDLGTGDHHGTHEQDYSHVPNEQHQLPDNSIFINDKRHLTVPKRARSDTLLRSLKQLHELSLRSHLRSKPSIIPVLNNNNVADGGSFTHAYNTIDNTEEAPFRPEEKKWKTGGTWGKRSPSDVVKRWRTGGTWGKRSQINDSLHAEEKRWKTGGTWGKRSPHEGGISHTEEKRWKTGGTWGKRSPLKFDISHAEEKRWKTGGTWGKRSLSEADTSPAVEKRWKTGGTWGKRSSLDDTPHSRKKRWSSGASWGKRSLTSTNTIPTNRWVDQQEQTVWQPSYYADIRAKKRWTNKQLALWGKRTLADEQNNNDNFELFGISIPELTIPYLDAYNGNDLSFDDGTQFADRDDYGHLRSKRSIEQLLQRHFIEEPAADVDDLIFEDAKRAWNPLSSFKDWAKREKWTVLGPKRGWNGPIKQSWGKRDLGEELDYQRNGYSAYYPMITTTSDSNLKDFNKVWEELTLGK